MGHDMRRAERQLSVEAAAGILERGAVCQLALVAQGEPYLVTMNYGYRDSTLYFHCAGEGRKMEFLAEGSRVCFTVVTRHELAVAETACSYGMNYESVVGYGKVRWLDGHEEKCRALAAIMAQYAPGEFRFPEAAVIKTAVFALDVEDLTGKSNLDPVQR